MVTIPLKKRVVWTGDRKVNTPQLGRGLSTEAKKTRQGMIVYEKDDIPRALKIC